MTTHCELGLSGCLQVWRRCWGNYDLYLLEQLAQNKIAAAHTKMGRSMLNITYRERKTNIWVRERTKVRYNQQCENNEMVPGRAHQPPQRRHGIPARGTCICHVSSCMENWNHIRVHTDVVPTALTYRHRRTFVAFISTSGN